MDPSFQKDFEKDLNKFKSACKNLISKQSNSNKCNVQVYFPKFTTILQQLNTPSIIPYLFDLWEYGMSIFQRLR